MNKNNKAFTLVELIVVITIIAILGTIAFISLGGYSKTARDSRRISDIANIKTALELFILNAGYYPQPDVIGSGAVYYSGDLLWTQGTVGNNVATNLSRNLKNKPLDPLFDIEYIYSIANSNKEYQLMALYEGEISKTNSILNATYAANIYNVKVEGTYNEIFLKTPNYIVPVPSLITSELTPFDLEVDAEKIESMVVTNGTNFPNLNIPNTEVIIGELNINLSVYTGTINSKSSTGSMISVINAIQEAYNSSVLVTKSNYKTILNKTSNEDKLVLASNIVLNKSVSILANSTPILTPVNGICGVDDGGSFSITPTNLCTSGTDSSVVDGGEGNNYTWSCNGINGGTNDNCSAVHSLTPVNGICGVDDGGSFSITPTNLCTSGTDSSVVDGGEGNNYTWSCNGINGGTNDNCSASHIIITTYPGCNEPDITVGGITIAACNLGTNIASTGWDNGYGQCFQWGNNAPLKYAGTSNTRIGATTDDSTFINATFIMPLGSPWDWTSLRNDNLWGDTTNTNEARRGPCASGYHVPSNNDWINLLTAGGWDIDTDGLVMSNALKMPAAGSRNWSNGIIYEGGAGDYWSSTPGDSTAYFISFNTSIILNSLDNNRVECYSVRCFKN